MFRGKQTRVEELAIRLIDEPPSVRVYYDDEKMDELERTIKKEGILQPLLVRQGKKKNRFDLVIGSRRLRAARNVGLLNVPSIIVDYLTDADRLMIALTENVQRQDLDPYEEAWAFLQLMRTGNLPTQAIAKKIGKHRSYVTKRIQLLTLSESVQDMIAKRQLGLSHAVVLARIQNHSKQLRLARVAHENKLSPEELSQFIAGEMANSGGSTSPIRPVEAPTASEPEIRAPAALETALPAASPSALAVAISPTGKVRVPPQMTGTKMAIRLKSFTSFIRANKESVPNMLGGEIINVKAALNDLIAEAQQAVHFIEEECGKF